MRKKELKNSASGSCRNKTVPTDACSFYFFSLAQSDALIAALVAGNADEATQALADFSNEYLGSHDEICRVPFQKHPLVLIAPPDAGINDRVLDAAAWQTLAAAFATLASIASVAPASKPVNGSSQPAEAPAAPKFKLAARGSHSSDSSGGSGASTATPPGGWQDPSTLLAMSNCAVRELSFRNTGISGAQVSLHCCFPPHRSFRIHLTEINSPGRCTDRCRKVGEFD